jgi:hypothetical protein
MRKDGSFGDQNTSEQLQKSWKRRMEGQVGVIWTEVSYSHFVQGQDKQTWFHKAHGWKTDEQVKDEYGPKAVERLAKHVREALNG